MLQILLEKICVVVMKLEFWGPTAWLKKTLTQMFSSEIYKLFKNNYFEEHLCERLLLNII